MKPSATFGTQISTWLNFAAGVFGAIDGSGIISTLPPSAGTAVATFGFANAILHAITGNSPILGQGPK